MENARSPQLSSRETSTTEVPATKRRRRAATMMTLLMDRANRRPPSIERQSRRASLMSMARRAVRHATQEPRSLASRLERDRLLRRWQRYTSALANYSSSWRIF